MKPIGSFSVAYHNLQMPFIHTATVLWELNFSLQEVHCLLVSMVTMQLYGFSMHFQPFITFDHSNNHSLNVICYVMGIEGLNV